MPVYRRRREQARRTSKLSIVAAILRRLNWRGKLILACIVLAIVAVPVIILLPKGGPAQVVSIDKPVPTQTITEPTPAPTPVPVTTPKVTPDPTLKKGDENEHVQKLQEKLMNLGYLDIDETTQRFGPATEQAVKLFQRQEGFEQTGVADGETIAWLFAGDAKHYTLLKGMEGEDVRTLQFRLNELGYLEDGKLTSKYGDLTENAVKDFQKRNNLTADGKTGEKTLGLIYSPNAKATIEKQKELNSLANADEVIAAAKAVIGKPYVLGREGPNSFDCSGLVYWCLHQAGSNVGRFKAQGFSEVAKWDIVCEGKMDFNKLKRGDLLFLHVPGRAREIGHVAIYIGNRTVIDASSSQGKIVERRCDGPWFTANFVRARRPYGSA